MTPPLLRCTAIGFTVAILSAFHGGIDAAQQPGRNPSQPAPPDSREFISKMAIAGMTEVQLGKVAAERGTSADVKAFGQMMVRDHSQANKELAQIASQLKMEVPAQLDQKHRDLVDRLSKLQGAEFDREYMAAMVQGHEEVVRELQARTGNRLTSGAPAGAPQTRGTTGTSQGEQALTDWAAKTLPVVQQHLERARAIQQKTK